MSVSREDPSKSMKSAPDKKRLRLLLILLVLVAVGGLITLPWQMRIRQQIAQLQRQEKQWQAMQIAHLRATETLQQAALAVNLRPNDPKTHALYADLLQQQNRFAEADTQWQLAVQLDSRNAGLHAAYADCLTKDGKEDMALLEYERALALDPNNLQAILGLSWLYLKLGWNQDAISLLKHALKAHFSVAQLHVALAIAYSQSLSLIKAEKELLFARQLAPTDPTVLGSLAEVYSLSDKPSEALTALNEAIAHASNPDPLLVQRAKLYNTLGQPDRALQDTDAVLHQEPYNLEALFERGKALQTKGDLKGAVQAWQPVYERAPNLENVGLLLGRAYVALGQRAAGLALIRKSLQARHQAAVGQALSMQLLNNAHSVPIHLKLAQFYLKTGNLPRAIIEFSEVCRLDPHNRVAMAELKNALHRAGRPITEWLLPTTATPKK